MYSFATRGTIIPSAIHAPNTTFATSSKDMECDSEHTAKLERIWILYNKYESAPLSRRRRRRRILTFLTPTLSHRNQPPCHFQRPRWTSQICQTILPRADFPTIHILSRNHDVRGFHRISSKYRSLFRNPETSGTR